MIEVPELGMKIAENPRDALVELAKKQSEQKILTLELQLELEKVDLVYLNGLKK